MLRNGNARSGSRGANRYPVEINFATSEELCHKVVPLPGAARECRATLLGFSLRGRSMPASYPELPQVGRRVILRFSHDGFMVQEEGHSSPPCPVVVMPCTVIGPAEPGPDLEQNLHSIRVSCLYPLWSIDLRLPSRGCAKAFELQVVTTGLHVALWMHADFHSNPGRNGGSPTSEKGLISDGRDQEPGSPLSAAGDHCAVHDEEEHGDPLLVPIVESGDLIYGTYVLALEAMATEHKHNKASSSGGPVVRLLWMELKVEVDRYGKKDVILRYFNHHGDGSHIVGEQQWPLGSRSRQWKPDVANHVLFTTWQEPKAGVQLEYEAPMDNFLALRDPEEAEALHDLVCAVTRSDAQLRADAVDRLRRWRSQLRCRREQGEEATAAAAAAAPAATCPPAVGPTATGLAARRAAGFERLAACRARRSLVALRMEQEAPRSFGRCDRRIRLQRRPVRVDADTLRLREERMQERRELAEAIRLDQNAGIPRGEPPASATCVWVP